jgi:hypothetical protein
VSQRSWSKTLPAYGQFHTDPEGRLWVRDYLPNGDPHGWTAFDDSGRMLGRLLLPARESGDVSLEVIGFGPEEILVRRRAPNGAVYLAVFPVVRIGPKDQ